jgi:hypothetical protein
MTRSSVVNSVALFLTVLSLAGATSVPHARSHTVRDNKPAIKNLWESQILNSPLNYTLFFEKVRSDIVYGNTIESVPEVGLAQVQEGLLPIPIGQAGYTITEITGLVVDQNHDGTIVFAQANKTLCGTSTGLCAKSLNYGLIAYFDDLGYIYKVLEIVPGQFLEWVIPELHFNPGATGSIFDMCTQIETSCAGIDVDYGTKDGVPQTCYQHWIPAPYFGGEDYRLSPVGYGTVCGTLNLIALLEGASPSDICPKFGVKQVGQTGCW